MYDDPDPCSTADKSQSCQSEYIGFTTACVVVCVTGAKTREEGEGSEGKRSRNEKKLSSFSLPFFPFLMIYNNRVIYNNQATNKLRLVDGNRVVLSANVDHSLRFAILSIHPV